MCAELPLLKLCNLFRQPHPLSALLTEVYSRSTRVGDQKMRSLTINRCAASATHRSAPSARLCPGRLPGSQALSAVNVGCGPATFYRCDVGVEVFCG